MQILTRVDRETWLEVARRCAYATFFHTPLWQELALATYPHYRDATIGALLPSGVRAVLPLLAVRRLGPLQDLRSSFELYYGGLIADGPLSATEEAAIYRAACSWRTICLMLTDNPLPGASRAEEGFYWHNDYTHMVELDGSFETSFQGFSKNCRNAYRSGLSKGVSVRRAASLADCEAYYGAYQDGLLRWQERGVGVVGQPYSWQQFSQCYRLANEQPEHVQLWVAEVDGRVVAGNWVFYWGSHAVCWHGAARSDFLGYRPFNVLDVEVMRDASARGYSRYDFGPSGGVEGVISYKESFRAQRYPLRRGAYTSVGLGLTQRAYRAIQPLASRLAGSPSS